MLAGHSSNGGGWESFFGFKRSPFTDNPDDKQIFASVAWQRAAKRLDFLAQHRGVGLLTGEVGAGKSTAARMFAASLHPNAFKVLYIHFTSGSALDLLRQVALTLDLQPAHRRGDLVRQVAATIAQLNQNKKQHPVLLCDEAHLMPHSALEQLPLLLNFDMDSSCFLSLLLIGQPLLERTMSLQIHEALRQRVSEALTAIFKAATTKDDLFTRLTDQRLELYRRGKTVGVRDLDTGRNHRLTTLGLADAFKSMSARIESGLVAAPKQVLTVQPQATIQPAITVAPPRPIRPC